MLKRWIGILIAVTLGAQLSAQCSVTAQVTSDSDPRGLGLAINVTGGTVNNSMSLDLFCGGGIPCLTEFRSVAGSLAYFWSFTCGSYGLHSWRVHGSCLSRDAEGHSIHAGQTVTGSYEISNSPTEFRAEILDPPVGGDNVRIHYGFPLRAGGIRLVSIDGGPLPVEGPNAGSHDFTVTPGRHTATLTWCGETAASLLFDVPKTTTQVELEAVNVTMSAEPERKIVGGTATVTVPLGTRFALGLKKVTGGTAVDVASDYSLGPLLELDSALADPTLYPDTILLEFDASANGTSKMFQAFHLGSQNVIISPSDGSFAQQVVTVNVVRPARLGKKMNVVKVDNVQFNLDEALVTWCHKHGMPPQIGKAIVWHESLPKGNAMTYRYEPLSTDYKEFSPRGLNQRTEAVYRFVHMEYGDQPRGIILVDSEDVHPRGRFYANKITKTRIADSTEGVTAKLIYENNDHIQHWLAQIPPSRKAKIEANPDLELGWNAQTTIAASYGLMQVLYSEAVRFGGGIINGQRRPYFLFDRPEHVSAEASSVTLGPAIWADKFRAANNVGPTAKLAPAFKSPDKLDEKLEKASWFYNGTKKYGKEVMEFQRDFVPEPAEPLLK